MFIILQKSLDIYKAKYLSFIYLNIYYLFVSQPLPLLSPAAASQFEGVGENQWERVCVLELWPDTGYVAES